MSSNARICASSRRAISIRRLLLSGSLLALCPVACAPEPLAFSLTAPPGAAHPRDDELPAPVAPPPGTPAEDLFATNEVALLTGDDGRSPELVLEVPPEVAAVQLVASTARGASLIVAELIAPDGSVLVAPTRPDGESAASRSAARGFLAAWLSKNRAVAAEGLAAFSLPSTPDVSLRPGRYRLRLRTAVVARVEGEWDVTAVSRPVRVYAVGVPPRGSSTTLAISLYATPGSGVDVENGQSGVFLREALLTASEAWSSAGVELAVGVSRNLDDASLDIVSLDASCSGGEMDAVLESTVEGTSLPVVFVDSFECLQASGADVGDGIRGQAGGLPAPAWLSGSRRAGVVIATRHLSENAELAGAVLAHELGHALGLWHTQESGDADPPAYDPVADTPDDAVAAEQNLMYFHVDEELLLSEGQARVARHSPWVIER